MLLSGAAWQAAGQIAPLVVNLALTPFVISSLGLVAYGLFLVVSTLTQFMGQFDGGISRSAQRYFAIYAGQDDRAATTRLLCSLLVTILAVTAMTLGAFFLLAPRVVDFFHTPADLESDVLTLLRVLVFVTGFALMRNLFASILNAYQRFGLTASTWLGSYAVYAIGTVLVLNRGMGLAGLAYVFIAQQVLATVAIVPACGRHLSRSHWSFLPWAEMRRFLAFAWRVQITGLLSLLVLQTQTLIVARLIPAQVPYFGPGATFAHQLRQLPLNAVGPIQSHLGRALSGRGSAAAASEFAAIQRVWVIAVCGMVAAGAPAAFVGVNVWLPLDGITAGAVAATMLIAHLIRLLTQLLALWAMLLGKPQLEMRASSIAAVVILGVSIGAAPFWGIAAVIVASVLGQAASSAYLILASRTLDERVPSPLGSVPWIAAVATALASGACVAVMHWCIGRYGLPGGGIGLVLVGLAATPALLGYGAATIGLRRCLDLVRRRGGA